MIPAPFLAPVIGAAIGGGASLLGGALQNHAAKNAADRQMSFQQRSNERQMQFQEHSAKHQYQWSMQDMKAAGLNPILAYRQSGPGILSGSSSTGSSYTPQNIGAAGAAGAGTGASSALASARNQAELANIAADTHLKGAQDKTQYALMQQAMAQAGQANANTAVALQDVKNKSIQSDILREALIQAIPKSKVAKHDSEFWESEESGILLSIRRFMESINPALNTAKSLPGF